MSAMEMCLIMLGVVTLVSGQPQYEVQVRYTASPPIFSYLSGRENQLANGSCCVYGENPPCDSPCNQTQITVCFREAQHSRDDSDSLNCSLGGQNLDPEELNDDEIVTFSAPLTATSTRYPGSYQLYFEISAIQPLELIDRGRRTLNHVICDRTGGSFTSISGTGMSNVARLNLAVRVVCIEGYFGPDCGCSPRNDSTGHFTCAEDGTIVCLPGYQNPETNCTEVEGATQELTTMTTGSNQATEIPEMTAGKTTQDRMETPTTSNIDSTINTEHPTREATYYLNTPTQLIGMDIVPIVAGGVAGGLVLLMLILIVNIVLVVLLVKAKYTKNNRDIITDEQITMTSNPVYEVNKSGHHSNETGDNIDYEVVQ